MHNTWQAGGHNKIQINGFFAVGEDHTRTAPFEFDADEPPVMFGEDKGANPVEYLLAALSGCMTTTLVYHAAAKGFKIEKLNSDFAGDLDVRGFMNLSKDVPIGYQKIAVTFHIKTDAPIEELEKLYHFSPVYSMVSKAVPIEVTFIKN